MKKKSSRFVKFRTMSHLPKILLVGFVVCLATGHSPAASNDPSYYIRKSNWHESFCASAEAIAGRGLEDGFAAFESDTLRGGDAARQIRVPLAGATYI
jgi:hypothetical protein